MNNKIFRIIFTVFCLLLIQSNLVFSANEEKVVSSGEKIAETWNANFKKDIDVVNKFRDAGWGVRRYKLIEGTFSYDVIKTDSLTSPYMLLIKFKTCLTDNCGSPNANGNYSEILKKQYCFKTIEDALNNVQLTDFADSRCDYLQYDHQINYAYQKGKWIFKGGNDVFMMFLEQTSNLKKTADYFKDVIGDYR